MNAASDLWKQHFTESVTAQVDLNTFRSGAANYHIALWDPTTNGVKYLKFLIAATATHLTTRELSWLLATQNRDMGKPIQIRWRGHFIDLDYLQAAMEVTYIDTSMGSSFGHVFGHVIEIGPGYGRTCHTMLSKPGLVKSYTLCDLPNSLILAERYLRAVLTPEQYALLRFIDVSQNDMPEQQFDLCINIDSFNEMPGQTVGDYLRYIDNHCEWFYTKNPVGKYVVNDGDKPLAEETVRAALRTGILTDIVDIDDDLEVAAAALTFIKAFRPSHTWRFVKHSLARPITFYWQALYMKESK